MKGTTLAPVNNPLLGLYGNPSGVIRTFSGRYLNVSAPDPADICIEDIAHGLANTCRWGGQCPEFYSVAQHCMAMALRADNMGKSPALCMAILMHDASEAYLGDIPQPVKYLLRDYRVIESRLQAAIWQKFGITCTGDDLLYLKQLDKYMLEDEWTTFFGPQSDSYVMPFKQLPEAMEKKFLHQYNFLSSCVKK